MLPLQDILICIQTNTNVEDEGRLRMAEDSYYLRSPQEMAALWAEVPDAHHQLTAHRRDVRTQLGLLAHAPP